MRGFVVRLEKVEVVDNGGQLGLFGRVAVDGDFEFSPTFVGANEGRFGEGYIMSAFCFSPLSPSMFLCLFFYSYLKGVNILCVGFSKVGCRL